MSSHPLRRLILYPENPGSRQQRPEEFKLGFMIIELEMEELIEHIKKRVLEFKFAHNRKDLVFKAYTMNEDAGEGWRVMHSRLTVNLHHNSDLYPRGLHEFMTEVLLLNDLNVSANSFMVQFDNVGNTSIENGRDRRKG